MVSLIEGATYKFKDIEEIDRNQHPGVVHDMIKYIKDGNATITFIWGGEPLLFEIKEDDKTFTYNEDWLRPEIDNRRLD